MSLHRSFRLLIAALLGIVVAGGLTGCIGVSARDTVAPEFEVFLLDQPGVTAVDVSVSTPLPYGGEIFAKVTLVATVDDEGIRELLHDIAAEVAEWRSENRNITFWVDLFRGPDVASVANSREGNDAVADLLIAARATPGVIASHVSIAGTVFTLESADEIVATFDDLSDAQAESSEFPAQIYVRDTDDRFVIDARYARPDAAIAVFEAVRAEIPVTEARLSEREAELRLPTRADIQAANQIAEPLWTGEPDALLIQGGIVTTEGGGDFGTVEPVVAAVEVVPGVVAVFAESDGVSVRVDAFSVVAAVREAVASVDETPRLTYLSIVSEGVQPAFQLYGPGASRGERDAVVGALLDEDYLVEVSSREADDSFHIEVGGFDPTRLAAFAAELKAVLPTGSDVQLETADFFAEDFGIRFRVADELAAGDVEQFRGDSAQVFIDGWNGD